MSYRPCSSMDRITGFGPVDRGSNPRRVIKRMKTESKKLLAATFTLVGTVIGAGILGLPYVFSQSGFFIGLFWLLFLGIILLYVNLALGEITLRTRKIHQLPGYAETYLGKKGKNFVLTAFGFAAYSAMLAYLIGEGQSLSQLFTGGLNYAIYFGIGFWILMTFMLHEGLRGLRKIETIGVLGIILIILVLFGYYFPQINANNFNYMNPEKSFLPFGVVLFALLGFTAIPEMRRILKNKEHLMKKSIYYGKFIPVVLYILFAFTFVGILGLDVPQVATLAFGRLITILGIFTMMTSYFVYSFALKDMFLYDLKNTKVAGLFVSVVPLLTYILVSLFGLVSFVEILALGGAIAGGAKGAAILVMNKKSKEKGNRNPEFSVPISWFIIIVISLIFFLGMIAEILNFIG